MKDVEVTLSGTNGIPTGIILDGSEEVGGYTLDNLKSYTISALNSWKTIEHPYLGDNNEIMIRGAHDTWDSSKGPCKIRIRIE